MNEKLLCIGHLEVMLIDKEYDINVEKRSFK